MPGLTCRKQENLIETLEQILTACYIINATYYDPTTKKWLEINKDAVKESYDWLKDHKWTER